MTTSLRQNQEDEIIALTEFFGENLVTFERGEEVIRGRISIELEPKNVAVTLYDVNIPEGRKEFKTRFLSPVDLIFSLPVDYPTEPAKFDIECVWISNELVEYLSIDVVEILRNMDDVIRENQGFPLLFVCCQFVKDYIQEVKITEILLDNNPYSIRHEISGKTLLSMVRNLCEEYEMMWFNSNCHDCEVCFDNKSGPECVYFLPCRHVFCKDCVRSYFELKLTTQQVTPLSCLSSDCYSCPSDNLIIDMVGQEQFDRYQEIITSNAILRMQDFVLCPRIYCGKAAEISCITADLATCLVCKFSFCTKCRRVYHGVESCKKDAVSVVREVKNPDGTTKYVKLTVDEYMAADEDKRKDIAVLFGGFEDLEAAMEEAMAQSNQLSEDWLKKYTRECPACGISILVDKGCNHVFCRCGTSFCYGCGEILDGADMDWRSYVPCKQLHKKKGE
ncbi:IBR domain protein [Dictyocaulus viviparus]|uniref:RBR-type E3 ubiquitin transferase n=1 Tax=Dictyocaulus viviparus TaxID=29172 RepID=A0A0D8XTN1_DICVI|nr:IBR domain protein [Dictyocaulus viviparus]